MATTPPNASFDALVTTTLQNFRPTLVDNITDNQVILFELKRRGFVREEPGGRTIVENILHGQNTTVKSYKGYDLLDKTPQTGITAAEFEWKQLAGAVTISGEEEAKNADSRSRILSLLESKMTQLQLSFDIEMETQLLGDGTGNDNKDIGGLDLLVEDGTSWSTVGGIDSDANTFWRNQFLDFDASNTSFSTASGQSFEGIKALRTEINNASRGSDRPNLILTSQTIFEEFLTLLEDRRRFTDQSFASSGFDNIRFDGIPIVWSTGVAADDIYILNSKYLRFVIHSQRNFASRPFVEPVDQDARTSKVLLMANMTVSNRARQGRLIDVVV